MLCLDSAQRHVIKKALTSYDEIIKDLQSEVDILQSYNNVNLSKNKSCMR